MSSALDLASYSRQVAADYRNGVARLPEDGPISRSVLGLPDGVPIHFDVGFGRGASVKALATHLRDGALPDWVFGLEIRSKWAFKVQQWAETNPQLSTRVFCGDVQALLSRRAEDLRFAAMYLHFPDPWWKKRHAHRLVLNLESVSRFALALEPGGSLLVQTDVLTRFERYRALLEDEPGFSSVEVLDANPTASVSNREARAEQDGLPVYRLLATR